MCLCYKFSAKSGVFPYQKPSRNQKTATDIAPCKYPPNTPQIYFSLHQFPPLRLSTCFMFLRTRLATL